MVSSLKISPRLQKGAVLLWFLTLVLVSIPVNIAGAASPVDKCKIQNVTPVPGNLLYALNQAGTITFSCSGTLSLPDTYTISHNTVIDGSGHTVTLSGLKTHRLFVIKPGVTLTLKNLTIKDGYALSLSDKLNQEGGAIYNQGGNLKLDRVVLQENAADKGGTIYNSGKGTITVQDSYLSQNFTAQGSYWHHFDGGAIYLEDGTLTVNNSTFSQNLAYDGGAIGNDKGSVTIQNSNFSQNHTQHDLIGKISDLLFGFPLINENGPSGGAINSNSPITVHDSRFSYNTADSFGGAISSQGGQLTNDLFDTNTVTRGNGGAISNQRNMQITGSTLVLNTAAAGNGGGIYNNSTGILSISTTYFNTNKAKLSGGGLYNQGYLLKVYSSNFVLNVGAKSGGGIETENQSMVANSTFTDNDAAKGTTLVTFGSGQTQLYNVTIADDNSLASMIVNQNAISLVNTIVYSPVERKVCEGKPIIDGGNNLQYPNQDCGASIPVKDPQLLWYADNGGSTQTRALKPISPAIDAGNNAICSSDPIFGVDQRSYTRPADGNGDGQAKCDIGAFEYNAKPGN